MQLASELWRNGKGILLIGMLVTLLTACGGSDNDPPTGDPGPNPPPTDGNNDGGDDGADDGNNDGGDDGSDDDGGDTGNSEPVFTTYQAASLVIGQPDFAGGEVNQGGAAPGANTVSMAVGGIAYASGDDVMFIADPGNARVLGYLGIPDVNNANADFVLGQPDFTSSTKASVEGGTISATTMHSPESVSVAGGQLTVTDTGLNRVTVYEGVPAAGGANPVLVVGQASLDTYAGSCDASTLQHPHQQFITPDGKLIVADAGHNRVMVWNAMPTENGAAADLVLGQINFDNCSNAETFNFQHPSSIWSDGDMLIVADSEKNRVLIWNTFPESNLQAPDVILGQADMEHSAPNDDDQDGTADGGYSWVACDPPSEGCITDENNGDATARTLSYPRDLEVADGKLYVADMNNNRVLIWNTIPTESFAPADIVIGQEDMTSNAPNAGQAQANELGFEQPIGVSVVDDQLFVTDWKNSRVLAFEKQAPAG